LIQQIYWCFLFFMDFVLEIWFNKDMRFLFLFDWSLWFIKSFFLDFVLEIWFNKDMHFIFLFDWSLWFIKSRFNKFIDVFSFSYFLFWKFDPFLWLFSPFHCFYKKSIQQIYWCFLFFLVFVLQIWFNKGMRFFSYLIDVLFPK
jgi:hypothetical protein